MVWYIDLPLVNVFMVKITLPEVKIFAPENGSLEDDRFREGIPPLEKGIIWDPSTDPGSFGCVCFKVII